MATEYYVFEVKYEQRFEDVVEPIADTKRVAVSAYDAQLAVDKVRTWAMAEEYEFDDTDDTSKCIGFSLSSVHFVTSYEA